MANSTKDMQTLLDVLGKHAHSWKFKPSFDKTKVMYFGNVEPADLVLRGMYGVPETGREMEGTGEGGYVQDTIMRATKEVDIGG